MVPAGGSVRVLVVDDSAFMRSLLGRLLREQAGFEVVGYAGDGAEAVAQVEALQPDAVTMDVEMPGMNGLEAVAAIMQRRPTPVVMVSAYTQQGAAITIEALARGAVDFVPKPSAETDLSAIQAELVQKLRNAAKLTLARLQAITALSQAPTPPATAGSKPNGPAFIAARGTAAAATSETGATTAGSQPRRKSRLVVAIGASTGGPAALTQLLPALPADLAAGVLIVQHMPAGFTKALAERLDSLCPFTVREAVAGEPVQDGLALVAPGDFHMAVSGSGSIVLSKDAPVHSVRPAADVLLTSVAAAYGARSIAVVLTGMGHDGAEGATEIKRVGGQTIVQDYRSSIVFGMASSVIEAGSADSILPLSRIANAIMAAAGR